MIRVTCLGATQTVTGSNFLIETPGGKKILVDCGLYQGKKQLEKRNWSGWDFDPSEIEILFLTHAHIDHSGRIPKLVKDGFQGRILTSPPTAELCEIMLLDSAHIQEMDAEWQSRKRRRQDLEAVEPLYTTADAEASLKYFTLVERDAFVDIEPGIRARLRNAGHILGSSILELWLQDDSQLKVVFSGDLGRKDQLIVKDPQEIFDADFLFMESTYGNRNHRNFEESREELLEAIEYSVSHGQKILIPAFAVERTQEILYILGELQREGRLPDIPIYLDSPLAIKATEIFRKNKEYYDQEALAIVNSGFDPFHMGNLKFTESTRESMAINEQDGPAIVIAANGMCTAGRIRHHLKHNLWCKGASVVIVGFQAAGTTGRRLVDGARQVKILGETITVNARIYTIGGFSAHADQHDLVQWVGNFTSKPRVFLIHGEESSSQALAEVLQSTYGLSVHIPRWKERIILKPREVVQEVPDLAWAEPDLATQAQNALIDLENEFKALKKRIKAKESVHELDEEDVERLQFVQEEIRALLNS